MASSPQFSSFERILCGCVFIRLSPAFALYVHLCDQHVIDQEDRAVFNISGTKEQGTRLRLDSVDVRRIQSEIALLLMDGRSWRRVRKLVANELMLEIPK